MIPIHTYILNLPVTWWFVPAQAHTKVHLKSYQFKYVAEIVTSYIHTMTSVKLVHSFKKYDTATRSLLK